MKAKDITTPGDYEVRPYKGGEYKATITKVEKRSVRVFPPGSFSGHNSDQWQAIEIGTTGKEILHPLGRIIRPWAEAEPEHRAAEVEKAASELVRAALNEALKAAGVDADVFGDGPYSVHLSGEQAGILIHLLLFGPDADA